MTSVLANGHKLSPRRLSIVNADEVIINTIPVNFVEYDETSQQVGSRTIVTRTPIQRTALISDYVPASLYETFMAMYDDFLEIQEARKLAQEPDEAADPKEQQAALLKQLKGAELLKFQDLQYQLVLAVWQNTEADMDLERLKRGLEEDQLTKLFTHFFSRLSRQKKKSAPRGGNTSSAPEPEAGEE